MLQNYYFPLTTMHFVKVFSADLFTKRRKFRS